MIKKLILYFCMTGIILISHHTVSAATFVGPSTYLSDSDSPFYDYNFDYFYLEDFEDSILNTPGVTASQGFIWPDPGYYDSVDWDDGAIDGSGSSGRSFGIKNSSGITFTFDVNILGNYPTHAGIVWTDAYAPNITSVYLEAFDILGSSLGVLGPNTMGDGSNRGTTAEDRFLGVINLDGISAIKIYQGAIQMEVDHLQYGFVSNPIILTLPGSATEGDGTLTNIGKVSIYTAPTSELIINLSSDDTSEVTVPNTVTIPEGSTSVTFDISIIDDTDVDGSQTVTITAATDAYGNAVASIQVNDNDGGGGGSGGGCFISCIKWKLVSTEVKSGVTEEDRVITNPVIFVWTFDI